MHGIYAATSRVKIKLGPGIVLLAKVLSWRVTYSFDNLAVGNEHFLLISPVSMTCEHKFYPVVILTHLAILQLEMSTLAPNLPHPLHLCDHLVLHLKTPVLTYSPTHSFRPLGLFNQAWPNLIYPTLYAWPLWSVQPSFQLGFLDTSGGKVSLKIVVVFKLNIRKILLINKSYFIMSISILL